MAHEAKDTGLEKDGRKLHNLLKDGLLVEQDTHTGLMEKRGLALKFIRRNREKIKVLIDKNEEHVKDIADIDSFMKLIPEDPKEENK